MGERMGSWKKVETNGRKEWIMEGSLDPCLKKRDQWVVGTNGRMEVLMGRRKYQREEGGTNVRNVRPMG
jgi:hypothetical protein